MRKVQFEGEEEYEDGLVKEEDDQFAGKLPAYEGDESNRTTRFAIILDKILQNVPKDVSQRCDTMELTRLVDTFDIGATSAVPTVSDHGWRAIGLVLVERIICQQTDYATVALEKFCEEVNICNDKLTELRDCLWESPNPHRPVRDLPAKK